VSVDVDGSAVPVDLISTPAHDWAPSVSPDGRWLAYTSDASGRYEVLVRQFGSEDRTWTVSVEGGEEPVWSRDGAELYFRFGDRWYVAPMSVSGPGRAMLVAEGPYRNVPGRSFDVAEDGRLLVLRPLDVGPRPDSLEVVLGWGAEVASTLRERHHSRR